MNEPPAITNLSWRRERNGWLLVAGRRRFGRVVPAKHSGMWQSTRSDGQPSDIANLSWTKNAVLAAAELELQFEDRQRRAIDPKKCPGKGGCFTASAPAVAKTVLADTGARATSEAAFLRSPQ